MEIKVSVWTMYILATLFLVEGFFGFSNDVIIGISNIILGISLILTTTLGIKIEKEEREENE